MNRIIQICKNNKIKFIITIITAILVGTTIFGVTIYYGKSKNNLMKQSKMVNSIKVGKSVNVTSNLAIIDIIRDMHKMANSLIEADAIWGKAEMNRKNVDEMYVALHLQSESDEKKILQEVIEKWDKADFSSIDADHNRIWNLLDGKIGRATGINNKEVEKAIRAVK